MLNIACTTDQKVPVTASPLTASGKAAQIDGALTVTVQSGAGSVEQDAATPLSFNAISGDVPGDTVYLVEGDADLGAGVVTIQDIVTLTVSGANAASFGLVGGVPVAK